jgi:drug/metabolite transporter (DMT)-like permease
MSSLQQERKIRHWGGLVVTTSLPVDIERLFHRNRALTYSLQSEINRNQGLPYSMALMLRFVLAALLAGLLLLWRRQTLPFDRAHYRAYAIAGSATSVSMLCSFWAAQYITSGLIAVLFGLAPLATALYAKHWLGSQLRSVEWLAIAIGVLGLGVIFHKNLNFSPGGLPGMGALLLGMAVQSSAAVQLKRHASELSAMRVNAGALLLAAILTSLFWLANGAPTAEQIPAKALAALVYLASIGSVLAFSLYYWLIRQCRPISVALISLITPASSLCLGHWLNDEVLHRHELIGTALIMLGLIIHSLKKQS